MARACLLMILAGCSAAPYFEERREWRRASVRVTLRDVDVTLGHPMLVTLDLRNEGARPFLYEAREMGRGSFDILGPDGREVPYIGWEESRPGEEQALDPRRSTHLLLGFDLSTEYLIDRPGRYRLRFSGRELRFWKPEEDGPGLYPIRLVSDWMEFTVREGAAPPAVELVRRLQPILPEGWRVRVGSFDPGSFVARLIRPWVRSEIYLVLGCASEVGYSCVLGRLPEVRYSLLADSPWGPVFTRDGGWIEPELLPPLLEALTRP